MFSTLIFYSLKLVFLKKIQTKIKLKISIEIKSSVFDSQIFI
jgi:hypothetical protein